LFATIGVVTWILSILAILFGKVIGPKLEKWGDLIASIVFCLARFNDFLYGGRLGKSSSCIQRSSYNSCHAHFVHHGISVC
jgi:hypothetical protein